ncbi:hypothetical protein [Allomesorhizobium camelthorni]|uniref:Uncharacterized protein n=1 Tax=Allomesorhizobium camelthorni TaxID=475069 RepID=A0A6G4WFQ5_9HYPH|nr:hypothetical protein [Mesorhizobium camelthorni]NGO52937.1 hypothetical protein [Mesorhizobium camelthorni]
MAEETKGMLQALDALIDMQKRMLKSWEGTNARFDRIDTEIVKITRQNFKTQEDLAAFRTDMSAFRTDITGRIDALASRMTEFENMTGTPTRQEPPVWRSSDCRTKFLMPCRRV